MVKYLFLLFPIIINSISAQVQIPNGGFEDWEAIKNFEGPIGWYTSNDTSNIQIEKDTISIEGKYSMKFIPVTSAPFVCSGIAGTTIHFKEPLPANSSLVFYVKTIPFNPSQDTGVYLIVFGKLFHAGKVINSYDWRSFAAIGAFRRIEIPLQGENIDALSMLIYGGSGSNSFDVCVGRSYSWIDGMSIESTTGINFSTLQEKSEISVYPNPSTGWINIDYPGGKIESYELYSVLGELITGGEVINDQLRIQERGMFVLKLVTNDLNHKVFFQKVIIQE